VCVSTSVAYAVSGVTANIRTAKIVAMHFFMFIPRFLVLTVRTERSKAVKVVFYYFLVCGIAEAMYFGAVKAKKNEKRLLSYLCYFGLFLVILFFI